MDLAMTNPAVSMGTACASKLSVLASRSGFRPDPNDVDKTQELNGVLRCLEEVKPNCIVGLNGGFEGSPPVGGGVVKLIVPVLASGQHLQEGEEHTGFTR